MTRKPGSRNARAGAGPGPSAATRHSAPQQDFGRGLFGPIPRAVLFVAGAGVVVLFALAWLSFRYPLSYCDSPGWAPNYLGDLIGRAPPPAASPRAWPATAFLGALGRIATGLHFANFIGLVQGLILLVTVLVVGRRFATRVPLMSLVLLPAFLASAMRHAIYSQTLLSEPLALAMVAGLALAVLGNGITPRLAVLAGAAAATLAAIRIDLAYFVPLLLLRPLGWPLPASERRRLAGRMLLGMGAAALLIAGVERVAGKQDHPTGRILMIAEWTPLTAAPTHPLAEGMSTPLSDRLGEAMLVHRFTSFETAMPLARDITAGELDSGWLAIARLVLYDTVNRPGLVLRHRLAVLQDLVASSYASFWPEYRSRSVYYSSYSAVFPGWSLDELDGGRYSPCAYLSLAQREYFHGTGVANAGACAALLELHRWVTPYARFVLRPLVWLALPALLLLVIRRRVSALHAWLAAMLGCHFLLRALLVCADERYQLPVDLLMLGLIARTVPDAVRALWPVAHDENAPVV
ncbi:MAG: hypothetical protein ABIS67_14860 [Candidatus Eisenbacteria bacterium]